MEAGALNELQPAVLSNNPAVALDASFTITALALRQDAAEHVESSDAINVIQDTLRTISPGTVQLPHLKWGSNDAPGLVARLSPDAHPVVQLACLHSLAATVGQPQNRRVIGGPVISSAVRSVAATQDPFVFGATIYILRVLGMPLPTYRAVRAGSSAVSKLVDPEVPIETWSINDVCEWVGTQPFRVFRSMFRDGMVSGSVLLSLTDADLEANGVGNSLHRRAILFAIKQMADAHNASKGGSSSAMIQRSLSNSEANKPKFDVFISYRRVGGADFAHLVKMYLKAAGYECFLDVENLGTGMSAYMNSGISMITVGCLTLFFVADPELRTHVID